MRYVPLRNVPHYVANTAPFAGNSMRGEWITGSIPTGMLNDEERRLLERDLDPSRPTYVVFSYATPIAYFQDFMWHIVQQKFSRTTSRHQSVVRRAILPASLVA